MGLGCMDLLVLPVNRRQAIVVSHGFGSVRRTTVKWTGISRTCPRLAKKIPKNTTDQYTQSAITALVAIGIIHREISSKRKLADLELDLLVDLASTSQPMWRFE
jgi:hypothetical protein